ncbi:hypothetical protein N9L06_03345 [Mariniblastus sp.]|nr:hypothetical protein [Mariniblastus sp.]
MNEKRLQFRVGLFVILGMLILGILIFLFSEGWSTQYTLYIKPSSAPGVTTGTPIRKNGILIGRVKSVINEDDYVLLALGINDGERIFSNEVVSIGTESFLGDAGLEFLPQSRETRGTLVGNDTVMGKVSIKRNPMEIIDIALDLEQDVANTLAAVRTAGAAVNDAGEGIKEITTFVSGAFQNKDSDFRKLLVEFRGVSVKAQAALDNFNRMFENMNAIVGDPKLKEQITDVLSTLPDIFQEMRVTISDTRETINSFRSVSKKAGKNLDSLQGFTNSLNDNGPEILSQVKSSIGNINGLVSRITQFTQSLSKLQNSEGTIGKLLNDTELYDSVLQTAENVRELSVRLDPMISDLRMFADAIARDPGTIGVRGALDRRPGKTGYKGSLIPRGGESPLRR